MYNSTCVIFFLAFRCLWWVVVVWGDAGGWVGGMDTSCLFTAALQLRGPWKVGSVDFRDAGDGGRGLHIMIGFEPGVRFHCPETGCRGVPVRCMTRGSACGDT